MEQRVMQLTVEEKINESSFTSVYRAFDTVLQRRVLLKVLHKHHASDHDLLQRFMREAQACAALRSEHIVQVYELVDYEGSPAIVMEYVEGTSLKNLITEGKTQSLKITKKVALHTLRGLVAAHDKGIIHRDVKPGNILVSGDGTYKVSDFGLAYIAFTPTVTAQGMVLGTPAYMSPEQIRHEEIDQRTDLFSLGATLIEVLTGNRLFDGNSYAECAKKTLSFKVDALEQFTEQSSPEFVHFTKLLMNPKKTDRFATSRDALYALDKKDSNIIITPTQVPKQKKQRVAILGAMLLLACVVLFFLFRIFSGSQVRKSAEERAVTDTTHSLITFQTEPQKDRHDPLLDRSSLKQQTEGSSQTKIDPAAIVTIHADSGFVLLTSTPWAKVYIDNLFIGETPISKPVVLAAGKHTVMFMHPSFEPILQTVTVQPHEELHIAGNFIENAGYLKCIAMPWAEVYVDEQYKETTPLEKPIVLSPGLHRVRFKNASFADIVREVTIMTKDTTSLSITFQDRR
jgi:serine/threonine protein kinase